MRVVLVLVLLWTYAAAALVGKGPSNSERASPVLHDSSSGLPILGDDLLLPNLPVYPFHFLNKRGVVQQPALPMGANDMCSKGYVKCSSECIPAGTSCCLTGLYPVGYCPQGACWKKTMCLVDNNNGSGRVSASVVLIGAVVFATLAAV